MLHLSSDWDGWESYGVSSHNSRIGGRPPSDRPRNPLTSALLALHRRLVREGGLDAVCDITTTELCDHQCGGVMDSGPNRLEAALQRGIPYVVSCGALDMCNFGPKVTVPEKYQDRKLYVHNPSVTLMRTNPEESKAIGNFMVDKIKTHTKDKNMVQVILPLGGVSIIATPDAPFYDKDSDEALFSTIRDGLRDSGVELVEDERDINDEGFATDAAKRLVKLMQL